jgi:hypothetical protein
MATSPDDKANSKSHFFTVQVQGPHNEEDVNHKEQLLSQLKDVPKDADALRIENDTPSDVEWAVLGDHFNIVNNLEMDTGWNEELNDAKMPLHWPLQRLQISSACGEVFRSPFVLEGGVKNLILLLTSGLRFEGPTSKELCKANEEAISRGEAEARYMTVHKGTPEEKKIGLVMIPELVSQWMCEKYSRQEEEPTPSHPVPDQINLEKLEILENDALDTFGRMTIALPHLVENLKTLNLRSTTGLDFRFLDEGVFREILPQLTSLETLVLSIGDIFEDEQYLATLYNHLPPNLSTLRFRGPISLCSQSENWNQWVEGFASRDFLPHLKKLSFVLDLNYETQADSAAENKKKKTTAPEGLLREAKTACDRLCAVARERGVVIEPFLDQWTKRNSYFEQVNNRWEGL